MPHNIEIAYKNEPSSICGVYFHAFNCSTSMSEWYQHNLEEKNPRKILILPFVHIYGVLYNNVHFVFSEILHMNTAFYNNVYIISPHYV